MIKAKIGRLYKIKMPMRNEDLDNNFIYPYFDDLNIMLCQIEQIILPRPND